MRGNLIYIATAESCLGRVAEDELLTAAFADCGLDAQQVAWNDPSVDWNRPLACVVRTTWDYSDNADAYTTWVERTARCTQLVNDAVLIQWNVNKRYLRDLSSKGVPVTPTVWVPPQELDSGGEWFRRSDAQLPATPFRVIKAQVGAGGRGVVRVDSGDVSAAKSVIESRYLQHGVMVQPFLDTVLTHGELSAIWLDGRVAFGVRKYAAPGEFRVQRQYGGSEHVFSPPELELEFVNRVIEAAPRRPVFARVDYVSGTHQSPMLIELEVIEPRLFLDLCPKQAATLAESIARQVIQ